MDIGKLDAIVQDCLPVEKIDSEDVRQGITIVDVHFIKVGVVMERAEAHRAELIELLSEWPETAWGQPVPKLEQGPSYIHAGGVVEDQTRALLLFGIGEALGFWKVMTPSVLGFEGPEADVMAGRGLVMIDGYNPSNVPNPA